jgi:hypothetical protein
MDKKIAGLLGAAAALATVGGANATEVPGNPAVAVTSYRELLNPVVNAREALKADDAQLARESAEGVEVAQIGHHHHHHHRRRHHHHHHHHHH